MQREETLERTDGASGCPVHSRPARTYPERAGKRPPKIRSVPFFGPVRQFTGDVLPFLTETRKQYGDAFRFRIFGIELTCAAIRRASQITLAGDEEVEENDGKVVSTAAKQILTKKVEYRLEQQ